jgi:anti-sigma factor (TIGR02949 family)
MTMSDLTRITCEEAFRRLDDYLDHELSAEETERVEDHLRICALCAREFNFEASVLKSIRRKLDTSAAPPQLVSRVRELFGPNGKEHADGQNGKPDIRRVD